MIHPKDHHKCFARLACVKHAASVHPEPGSNSLKKFVQDQNLAWLIFYPVLFTLVLFFKNYILWTFKDMSLFSYQGSFFVAASAATSLLYQAFFCLSRTFLTFFSKVFLKFFRNSLSEYWFYHCFSLLSTTFFNFLNFLFFSVYSEKIRRRRDLNPRTAWTVYTLSRGASSATWVLLQIQMHSVLNSVHQWRIWNYTLWIYFCQCFF